MYEDNNFNYYYYQPGPNILSYIANTSRMHTCTHARTRVCTHSRRRPAHTRVHARARTHSCRRRHRPAHTRVHARARTHSRRRRHRPAHTRVHARTAVAAVTVRRTGYRYSVSPNRDGPLRLRQCRSMAIQITTPLSYTNNWSEHSSAEMQGAAVTCYIPTGRRHDERDTLLCSKFLLQLKTGPNHCNLVLFFFLVEI